MRTEKFLRIIVARSTYNNYRSALGQFVRSACGDSATLEDLDRLVDESISGARDAQSDVENFFFSIKDKAPKTVELKLVAVREFLDDNDVILKPRFWRRLKSRKGGDAITADQPPTIEELRGLIQLMPVHGRAESLMLVSGGFRVGELHSLHIRDIDLDADPPTVRIWAKNAKTNKPRTAYISAEAAEMVRVWLKVREGYIREAAKKSWKVEKGLDDPRLFPYSYSVFRAIFNNALRKAGLDQRDGSTGRHIRHIHTLRKLFKTGLTVAVGNPEFAGAFMGHAKSVERVYSAYTDEVIIANYRKGEDALTVFSNRAETMKLRGELEGSQKFAAEVISAQQRKTEALEAEVLQMRKDLTEISKRVQI